MRWVASCLLVIASGCNLILGLDSPTLLVIPDAAPTPDAAVPAVITVGNMHGKDTGTERVTFGICPLVHWIDPSSHAFRKRLVMECVPEVTVDVPDGVDYYAAFGDQYTWAVTGSRQLDLGIWIIGRSGEYLSGGPTTRLDLNATGLSPTYEASDTVDFYSPTIGLFQGLPMNNPRVLTPVPAVGSADLSLGYDYSGFRLMGTTFDDKLLVTVGKWGPVNGQFIGRIKMAAPMGLPIIMQPDQTTSVSGALAAPPTRNVSIDFRRSQFDALHAQMNPNAMKFTTRVQVRVQPVTMAGDNQSMFATPWILYFDNNDVTDADLGTVAVGNPYPAAWILVRDVGVGYFVPHMMGGMERHARGFLRSIVDIDSVGPIAAPVISPPQGPTVNGRGAFVDGMDLGENPVVAWQAPATGTATRYIVRVWRFGPDFQDEVDFYLPARLTSLKIPPGIILPATWTVFIIDAVSAGGNPETEPFLLRLPFASASVITGKFAFGSSAPF